MDLLKEKINILDVVQKYVKLKKVGKYYAGLCPFHQETKPSFYVSEELQIFKCFGCGEGGDVIKFLMKIENLDYPSTLERLKQEYGLEIPIKGKSIHQHKKILEINYAALKFFRQKLKENQEALNYLFSRGLKEKTLEEFELGFSPGGTFLRDYLFSLGYSLKQIQEAGLVDSKNFDRFQSRIIFPLRDEKGKLVGFTGRIFQRESGPKYLNTPETPLFKKSQFLYGLFYAKDYLLQNKKVILVEGQFDFLLAYQNNFKNVVAVSGSALTEDHLRKLKRYCQQIVFAFDNDEAGFRASLRANLMAKNLGFQTYQLIYPAKDLGELFSNQINFELKEEKFEDYLLNYLLEKYGRENKKIFLEIFLPQIKVLKPLETDEYLEKLSRILNISKNLLEKELASIETLSKKPPGVSEFLEEEILIEEKTLEEKFALKLLSLLYLQNQDSEIKTDEEIQKYLPFKYHLIYEKIIKNNLNEKEREYFELTKQALGEIRKESLKREIKKAFKNLKKLTLKNQLKNLQERLKKAEKDEFDKIILEINMVLKELKNIEKN